MAGGLIEIAKLRLRCSWVETVREFLSTRLAFFHPKKSPYSTDPPGICVIGQSTVWGGVEQHTRELVKHLLDRGFHVKFIAAGQSISDPELIALESVAFEWVTVPLDVEDTSGRRAWTRAMRDMKCHAAVVQCSRVEFGSLAFVGALQRAFRHVIYIEHLTPTPLPEGFSQPAATGLLSPSGQQHWIEFLRRRYRMRCADRVVGVSEAVSRQLVDHWFVPEEKLITVPNGVSSRWERSSEDTRRAARTQHSISPEAVVFGMMARLSPEKGVDLALRSFGAFLEACPERDAALVIAGDGPERASLRRLAEDLGIADRVHWLGFVDNPADAYRLFDALLMPSRREGLPLALLEAMACGVVPIASDAGGMGEVIGAPSLGWLLPDLTVGALAAAMQDAAALSAAERDALSERVRQHVRGKYDLKARLDQFVDASGLSDHTTWNRTYVCSKLRDMCDGWIDFFQLWRTLRSFPEWPRPEPAVRKETSASKPSVCVIEQSHGWGGAENHTYMLLQHLQKHQYPIEYVSGKDSLPVPPPGIEPIRSPVSILDDGKDIEEGWAKTFSRLNSRIAVFATLDTEFGRSVGVMRAMRQHFDRIIYIEHTLPPPLPSRTPKRYLGGLVPSAELGRRKEDLRRKLRMRGPSHVVAVSDAVREGFIASWYCPPEKIETVRNGVDCGRFDVAEADRAAARKTHGIPDGAVVFGMMSRLNREKGVDLAVQAFAAYRKLDPDRDAYLVVGGTGPEAEALESLGAELGVAERIRWAGYITDPPALYAAMDMLLATSRFEGLPLALLEGMAAGLIPIVFRVGGMPEVINDPSLGWVVEPYDIAGVADAMHQASQLSPEQAGAYRLRVKQCVRERFDIEASNGRIAEIIEHG